MNSKAQLRHQLKIKKHQELLQMTSANNSGDLELVIYYSFKNVRKSSGKHAAQSDQ